MTMGLLRRNKMPNLLKVILTSLGIVMCFLGEIKTTDTNVWDTLNVIFILGFVLALIFLPWIIP